MPTHNLAARIKCTHECQAGALPPGFDLRDCFEEEFADVPATAMDYETNKPSRCAQQLV